MSDSVFIYLFMLEVGVFIAGALFYGGLTLGIWFSERADKRKHIKHIDNTDNNVCDMGSNRSLEGDNRKLEGELICALYDPFECEQSDPSKCGECFYKGRSLYIEK